MFETLAKTALVIFAAYIAGSVNFAVILLKLGKKGDPRESFSKNPGASNVYRIAGIFWAAATLMLDVGRSTAVAYLSLSTLSTELIPLGAAGLLMGARYPIFHGFRGGKGVANYLGFTALINPAFAAASCGAWLLVYWAFKKSFIGSFAMIAVLSAGLFIGCGYAPLSALIITAIFAFIVYNHKENIKAALR